MKHHGVTCAWQHLRRHFSMVLWGIFCLFFCCFFFVGFCLFICFWLYNCCRVFPREFHYVYFKDKQAPSRCPGQDPSYLGSPHLLTHSLQLSRAGPLPSLSSPPGQASPPNQQHCAGGPHPWKWRLLHQHPEVLNCLTSAEAFIIHPKPQGTTGFYSISPACKGLSADLWGLTIPQIPLQVKEQSSSPCTAVCHLCCFNHSCWVGLSLTSKPPKWFFSPWQQYTGFFSPSIQKQLTGKTQVQSPAFSSKMWGQARADGNTCGSKAIIFMWLCQQSGLQGVRHTTVDHAAHEICRCQSYNISKRKTINLFSQRTHTQETLPVSWEMF